MGAPRRFAAWSRPTSAMTYAGFLPAGYREISERAERVAYLLAHAEIMGCPRAAADQVIAAEIERTRTHPTATIRDAIDRAESSILEAYGWD